MCDATTCPAAANCHRNPASGTKPDDLLQSWMAFEPEKGPDCRGFWLVSERAVTDIDVLILHLETGDQPEPAEMDAAAILDNWQIAPCGIVEHRMVAACGIVSRSRKFADGEFVTTSRISSVDAARRWIRTQNSLYLLGARHRQMPFIVHVATRKDWIDAWRATCTGTGEHTVPIWAWAAAREAREETSDWTRRRHAASVVGEALSRAGRPSVAAAWCLLATDASDKDAAKYAYQRLCLAAGSHQTPEVSDVIDGWGLLAKASAETAGEDLSDCIAAAHRLGGRHQAVLKLPLLVRMVMAPNAIAAAKIFLAEATITAATAEAVDINDLLSEHATARRKAAREIIGYLNEDGSDDDMKVCLRLLALAPIDHLGRGYIADRIEECFRDAGRDPSAEHVAWAWRVMAGDTTSPVGQEDPIAYAWKLEEPARWTGTEALRELAIDVDKEMAARECGAVVLERVGGTAETSSGKDAKREFKEIAGKRLRLVCAADLGRVRTMLRDEFPHLHTQIDVLLSDFVEGKPIRLRPTLLVGAPGGGKSRLARRMAESLGVGLHRFDGSGSGDNAFGGTPRRWSTGEHCTPLEAVRRFAIANPWMLIDEADKAATGGHNGSLVNALLPMMDGETAKNFPDPYVQSDIDLSHVSYVLTANDDTLLPAPLRDRLRIVRLPEPTIEHLPALARGIVADIAKERGGDARWWPALEDGELAIAEELWPGGSVRRLRVIVERILAYREQKPRN
jgi:hypothetical protein